MFLFHLTFQFYSLFNSTEATILSALFLSLCVFLFLSHFDGKRLGFQANYPKGDFFINSLFIPNTSQMEWLNVNGSCIGLSSPVTESFRNEIISLSPALYCLIFSLYGFFSLLQLFLIASEVIRIFCFVWFIFQFVCLFQRSIFNLHFAMRFRHRNHCAVECVRLYRLK